MSVSTTLDRQIHRAGFWTAVVSIATTVVSIFLPLDAPGGQGATVAERVIWLNENAGTFILAWSNQIVAMLALSGMLAAIAWQPARTNPLSALLAASLIAMATLTFFIPKFIAIWTIPLLAEAIAAGGSPAGDMARTLLPLLNVSIPFSLYTSFDYLGFWLYSLYALLVALPLLRGGPSAKVLGGLLGVFGVLYQVVVVAILAGAVTAEQIEASIMSVALLLFLVPFPAIALFRGEPRAEHE